MFNAFSYVWKARIIWKAIKMNTSPWLGRSGPTNLVEHHPQKGTTVEGIYQQSYPAARAQCDSSTRLVPPRTSLRASLQLLRSPTLPTAKLLCLHPNQECSAQSVLRGHKIRPFSLGLHLGSQKVARAEHSKWTFLLLRGNSELDDRWLFSCFPSITII